MADVAAYFSQNPFVFVLCATILGLVVGSFLNVVIYRVPKMLDRQWREQCHELLCLEHTPSADIFNLITPNSHCPSCKTEISPLHNIPIISYVFLGGKCAYCKAPISIRYPIFEAVCGALTALAAYRFGLSPVFAVSLLLMWALIALTMIDFDHQLLPDDITLPLLWAGLIVNSFGIFTSLTSAVWGAIIGYVSLWSVYWFFKLLTNKEGMGYGDFKLFAALGAWMGWQVLPQIIIIASLIGSCVGIGLIVFKKQNMGTAIAFGPYLACAGLLTLFTGNLLY